MARSASLVPALMRFPGELAREAGWGRLVRLCASSAELSTQTALKPSERILLSFEVNGEKFEDLRCAVQDAVKDEDGYFLAELRFQDEVEKRRLAKVLADLLSRDIPDPQRP